MQGDVSGRIPAPGELQASLSGTGFNVAIASSTNGSEQAVTIVPQGTEVQRVNITMHKG